MPMITIDRVTIADLTDDQLDAALAQRRERRLLAFKVYQEGVESKKRATDEQLRSQLTKQLEVAAKEFAHIDKLLDKTKQRLNKIAGIRLALEDYNGNSCP